MNSLEKDWKIYLCWSAVKSGTSLHVEQMSVIFNGADALQN